MLKTRTFLTAMRTARQAAVTRVAVAVLAAVALFLATAPAVSAQQAAEKPGNVVRVYVTIPKPGAVGDYEAGRKRHMEVHKKMGDTWSWFTYQVESGENVGSFHTVTFEHHWKDFDAWEQKYAAADGEDSAKNLDPHVASASNSFFIYLRDASMGPAADPAMAPDPLLELIHFELKIGASQEFENAIKRATEAIQKTKWASNFHWFMLANGGSGPHYALALPKKNWAEMEPPAVPFPVMLEKALGAAGAKEVLAVFDNTVAREYSEILRYRPDLSYVPAGR